MIQVAPSRAAALTAFSTSRWLFVMSLGIGARWSNAMRKVCAGIVLRCQIAARKCVPLQNIAYVYAGGYRWARDNHALDKVALHGKDA